MQCPPYQSPNRSGRLYLDVDFEGTYGSGNGYPVVFPVYNTVNPVSVSGEIRNPSRAGLGFAPHRLSVDLLVDTIDGSAYMFGGTTPNDIPMWLNMLQICGFDKRSLPNRTTFTASMTQGGSATIRSFLDTVLHTSSGVRGNFNMFAGACDPIEIQYNLTGLHTNVEAGNIPVQVVPVPGVTSRFAAVNFRIKPVNELEITPILKSFNLTSGGRLTSRVPANSSGKISEIYFNEQKNPLWGCIIEIDPSKPWFQWFDDEQEFSLEMLIPTPGRRPIQFKSPLARISQNPAYVVDRGVRTLNLQFLLSGKEYLTISQV